MMICNWCGHEFSEMEYFDCPECGSSDVERAFPCPICGNEYGIESAKTFSVCDKCFDKYLTPEIFKVYATSNAKHDDVGDVLEDFIFYEVWDIDMKLEHSSLEFKEHCKAVYDELAAKGEIQSKIEDYIERDKDVREDFAEWLVEQKKLGGGMFG